MIRKLQYKFIAISGISILVVMVVLLFTINEMFYAHALHQAYNALEIIADNNGDLPEGDSKTITHKIGSRIVSLRYQLLYFSVWTDEEGKTVQNVDLDHSERVSKEEAAWLASQAVSEGKDKGIVKGDKASYCYLVSERSDGKLLVFMDCSWDLRAVKELRSFSLWFSLGCFALFLIVVSALSRKAIAPVIRNMEIQKQFITNAGHELKTPLAIISANTEVLEMMEGENEWTRSTMNQVERLDRLIANLITLSRMGEIEDVEIQEVDFSALLETAVKDFATLADQKKLRFDTQIEAGLRVKGIQDHLGELIYILCDNAIKYCDENGVVRIQLRKRPYLRSILLEVSNSYADGDNIDTSRLFERFYRGDTSHSNEKSGYGIGLAMAEGFVEECKGKISASYKEEMITFSVIFPQCN